MRGLALSHTRAPCNLSGLAAAFPAAHTYTHKERYRAKKLIENPPFACSHRVGEAKAESFWGIVSV